MAAFILEIGSKKIESDATEIDLGTRSSCVLSFRDSIAASRHAWIRRREGLFFVEDAGSATGTWKNGVLVTKQEPLADGDVLVLGTTKIEVKIEASSLHLVVSEQTFFFESSRKRDVVVGKKADGTDEMKSIVGGDAERWVKDETLFGRFAGLRWANVAAALIGVALVVVLALQFGRDRLLQPGELQAKHAMLFDREPPKDASDRVNACRAIAQKEGCGSCHGSLGGAPLSRCESCHKELMSDKHPFVSSRSPSGDLAAITMSDSVCATCHMDHDGRTPAAGQFIPIAKTVEESCTQCHSGTVPTTTNRKATEIAKVDYSIAYDAFPHKSHGEVKCDVCHAQPLSADRAAISGRDFARVPFETCVRCHAAAEKPTPDSPWSRDATLASYWQKMKPEHFVSLAWHGAGKDEASSHCLDCHAKVHDAALREVETQKADHLAFTLTRRGHVELFAGHVNVVDASGKSRTCTECHAEGSPLMAGQTKIGQFWHALHMKSVMPGAAADERALSAECSRCHTEQIGSKHLAGTAPGANAKPADANQGAYHGADIQSCKQCHKDDHDAALIQRVDVLASAQIVKRHDFPHEPHLKRAHAPSTDNARAKDPLANSCYSCHAFPTSDAPFAAMPITKPGASSCLDCHKAHANIAGDGCALCHPNSADGKADLVYAGKPARRSRAETTGFSHFSAGHKESTEKSCEECHTNAREAVRVSDVAIPSESESSCATCHMKERMHWRVTKVAQEVAPPTPR